MMAARSVGALAALLCGVIATTHAQTLPAPLDANVRQQRIMEVRDDIGKSLDGLFRQVHRPNPQPSVRDLPNGALAALVCGRDVKVAQELLRLAFSYQEMDEKSPHYGSVPWQAGHPEIVDLNADEFASQALGPIWLHYGDRLGEEFKAKMRPHLKAFLAAMQRREMKTPSYTNIFLMRATNTILLGQAVGDDDAVHRGTGWIDDWITYTRRTGIREFDSPTYYATDLNSLVMGYAYASAKTTREKFKTILDLFWTDIAANYMPERGCLTGPNSRNYSFLDSYGGVDLHLYLSGFRASQNITHVDLEKIYGVECDAGDAYQPGAQIYDLARQPERTITSRWEPGDRYSYLAGGLEMGCANADYGQQDKLITVEMASSKPGFPVMAVIPDVFDSPYGTVKTPDSSGHQKPTHLKLHPTVVQERGMMLALLDLNPADAKSDAATLATNVLLPAKADVVLLDGRAVGIISAGLDLAAGRQSVLAVREGTHAAAIRVLHVDGYDGQDPVVALKADVQGLKAGVARLVMYHYRGDAASLHAWHVKVALLMMAGPCQDDAALAALSDRAKNATWDDRQEKNYWTVRVQAGDVTLEAVHDLGSRKTVARTVNGHPFEAGILEVNGVDWARRVLGPAFDQSPR
jgi:hypothetical protein